MSKLWTTCLIVILPICSALADPPKGVRLTPGDVAPGFMYCFDYQGKLDLLEYQAECASFKRDAEECLTVTEQVTKPVTWYRSPWFFLAIGLGAGFGTAIAVTR